MRGLTVSIYVFQGRVIMRGLPKRCSKIYSGFSHYSSYSSSNLYSCDAQKIRYVNPQAVQWFPGHMRKGMNIINAKMHSVDVIIEIHDARIPFSGRPEFFQKFNVIRPSILLMNKIDLAEPIKNFHEYEAQIIEYSSMKNRQPVAVYFTQLSSPEKQKNLLRKLITNLPRLMQFSGRQNVSLSEFANSTPLDSFHETNSDIKVMVMGIPNSGKSTLINALRSVGRGGGGGAVRVGRCAGQTRSVGQPVTIFKGGSSLVYSDVDSNAQVSSNCRIQMFDTPGILEPRAENLCEQLSLCVCGGVDWNSVDQVLLVDYLLFLWNHCQKTEYVTALGLSGSIDNVFELLTQVCLKNNFFLTQGSSMGSKWSPCEIESFDTISFHNTNQPRFDFRRAANFVLRLFNKGCLGRITFFPKYESEANKYFRLTNHQ